MSDVAKWALLVAGAVLLITLILALPFVNVIDINELTGAVNALVGYAGTGLRFGRGLVNNFLSPFGRTTLTAILGYLVLKYFILISIKIVAWVYHFIFK